MEKEEIKTSEKHEIKEGDSITEDEGDSEDSNPLGGLEHSTPKEKSLIEKPKISKKEGHSGPEPSYKSQHGKLKRKAQRHRRQKKRRDFLDSMTKEEREIYLANEKIELAKKEEEIKQKLDQGKIDGRRIIIDCEYEAKMSDRENKSLISQLKYIYSKMKKTPIHLSLTITGYGGRLSELIKYHNAEQWQMNWEPRSLEQLLKDGILDKEKTVYLSPDATETVTGIDNDVVYIIGGLVDGSVLKDVSKTKAADLGIRSEKLDLAAFKGNTSFRNCLNINDVFYILVDTLEGKQLSTAIEANMPNRMKASK